MDSLKINPLWLSLGAMALRVGLLAGGLTTAEHADNDTTQVLGGLVTVASAGAMIYSKVKSHSQKVALAVAHPDDVTLPDGSKASSL